MTPEMKRDHQLTVRIPMALRRKLDREAKTDQRSVADVINLALQERYAKRPLQERYAKRPLQERYAKRRKV